MLLLSAATKWKGERRQSQVLLEVPCERDKWSTGKSQLGGRGKLIPWEHSDAFEQGTGTKMNSTLC